jgi:hypothetical protein
MITSPKKQNGLMIDIPFSDADSNNTGLVGKASFHKIDISCYGPWARTDIVLQMPVLLHQLGLSLYRTEITLKVLQQLQRNPLFCVLGLI